MVHASEGKQGGTTAQHVAEAGVVPRRRGAAVPWGRPPTQPTSPCLPHQQQCLAPASPTEPSLCQNKHAEEGGTTAQPVAEAGVVAPPPLWRRRSTRPPHPSCLHHQHSCLVPASPTAITLCPNVHDKQGGITAHDVLGAGVVPRRRGAPPRRHPLGHARSWVPPSHRPLVPGSPHP